MSQTRAILEVLKDNEFHSVREIHAIAGYSRLNSRVSELRKQGHNIECVRVPASRSVDAYRYRLIPPGTLFGDAA
jgi:hypothetical protein